MCLWPVPPPTRLTPRPDPSGLRAQSAGALGPARVQRPARAAAMCSPHFSNTRPGGCAADPAAPVPDAPREVGTRAAAPDKGESAIRGRRVPPAGEKKPRSTSACTTSLPLPTEPPQAPPRTKHSTRTRAAAQPAAKELYESGAKTISCDPTSGRRPPLTNQRRPWGGGTSAVLPSLIVSHGGGAAHRTQRYCPGLRVCALSPLPLKSGYAFCATCASLGVPCGAFYPCLLCALRPTRSLPNVVC
ncbi:hypothetical protein NDU88_002239 [Pleurodeles waltl]|uniref:Uncharacterized protein n=1 Tax=Pleurodeles waltl TaxID=8319 RepID=A0AAV7VDZ1_PLEWA|nr:hypothetical protein NDU88_002239 [Pleurodeles waltl]